MSQILDLPLYVPIPVGHRVSILPLEMMITPLFGGPPSWQALSMPLVCDENTRIIYADRSLELSPETTYEQILFKDPATRISQSQPATRGVVLACLALCDSGDTVRMHTILRVDTSPRLT